jgi:hypothetical protein
MFDILSIIPGKKKKTQSGWHSFNGVCCHHRGHSQDKRGRSGLKFDGNNWSIHCFNCNFKCGFTLGKTISKNCKQFLLWCGVELDQINKWNIQSLQNKDVLDLIPAKQKKIKVKFKEFKIEEGELLDDSNIKHKPYIEYLSARKIDYKNYPFLVTTDAVGRNKNRIIIPYLYNQTIVGKTSRYLDNKIPKYINEQQEGYVFGLDFQKPNWQYCLVVEGIFDALAIDGCAILHSDISPLQAQLLSSLNKQIIYIPDRDSTGLEICEKALDLGYKISLPDWDSRVKDVNDAVVKYGKLPTLLSILQSTTTSRIKLQMYKRKFQ